MKQQLPMVSLHQSDGLTKLIELLGVISLNANKPVQVRVAENWGEIETEGLRLLLQAFFGTEQISVQHSRFQIIVTLTRAVREGRLDESHFD